MSKEEKEKYLKDNGWFTLWADHYWVHSGIMAGANLDYCGVDIDSAVKIQQKRDGSFKE
ncbi:hypothetical protein SAMN05421741_11832 [Paenimyroides ummariense]|uniref:Uncharacterized protein n=1 Tax=Paenimyroides ummariense TaxID=913024 RepID=A0A1I5E0E0_9FLAO|nr:hypothetical protein [Paenimyroides ummariense]SFO04994.1 hypothetical protein SAMN05421741_11832 [Paenimyroides ummariense]